MAKVLTVIMLTLTTLSVIIDAQTTTKPCKGGRKLNTDEVSITNCQKGICKFPRGKSVEIVMKFTPDKEIQSLSTIVEANINGIQIPWIGVDGTTACTNIYNEDGEKVSCPLKAGEAYVYRNKFDVLQLYPRIQTIVHWALRSERSDVMCFEVPVRIV